MTERQPLALKYRPKTFDDLVGQRHIKPILKAMVESDQIPAALLFSGTRGTGKTTTGRTVAAALNCTDRQDANPCTKCPTCKSIFDGTSIDVIEVDAASHGSVDNIRKIKDIVMYASTGDYRVVLLDEVHSASKEAFNALLKVLEEPPPRTVFILLTTEPNKILDTVVSRCMAFEYRRISIEDISSRLRLIDAEEGLGVSEDVITQIAVRSQGGMRDAVMSLEQISLAGAKDLPAFMNLFGITNIAIDVMSAAQDGNIAEACRLVEEHFYRTGDAQSLVSDLTALVRDLLVEKAGGLPRPTDPDTAQRRQVLAQRMEIPRLIATARVLWDLKTKTRHTDNDQLAAMQLATVLVSDALALPMQSSNGNGNGHRPAPAAKLTLDRFKELAS